MLVVRVALRENRAVRRWLACVVATWSLGCGARSEADLPDAYHFASFPCRWSLGSSVEIARGMRITALTGAVHPIRDQVVVMATRDDARVGARIALSNEPSIVATLEAVPGEIFAGSDGWLRQVGESCAIAEHDDDFVERATFAYGDGTCLLSQSDSGRVESAAILDVRVEPTASSITYPGPELEPLGRLGGSPSAFLVRDPPRGLVLAELTRDSLRVQRVLATRERDLIDLLGTAAYGAAIDRVMNRVLLLVEVSPGQLQLAAVDWDGALELERLADLRTLPEPAGRLRSNEAEALLPLSDGTMAFFPLPFGPMTFTPPVEPDRSVEAMEIILRPGTSAGGLLYVHREPSGEAALRFRSLTCNR